MLEPRDNGARGRERGRGRMIELERGRSSASEGTTTTREKSKREENVKSSQVKRTRSRAGGETVHTNRVLRSWLATSPSPSPKPKSQAQVQLSHLQYLAVHMPGAATPL